MLLHPLAGLVAKCFARGRVIGRVDEHLGPGCRVRLSDRATGLPVNQHIIDRVMSGCEKQPACHRLKQQAARSTKRLRLDNHVRMQQQFTVSELARHERHMRQQLTFGYRPPERALVAAHAIKKKLRAGMRFDYCVKAVEQLFVVVVVPAVARDDDTQGGVSESFSRFADAVHAPRDQLDAKRARDHLPQLLGQWLGGGDKDGPFRVELMVQSLGHRQIVLAKAGQYDRDIQPLAQRCCCMPECRVLRVDQIDFLLAKRLLQSHEAPARPVGPSRLAEKQLVAERDRFARRQLIRQDLRHTDLLIDQPDDQTAKLVQFLVEPAGCGHQRCTHGHIVTRPPRRHDGFSRCTATRIVRRIMPMPATNQVWTTRRLLQWTSDHLAKRQVDSPRLCAEMLLAHVLGADRLSLYMDPDRPASDLERAAFRELVQRASEHEPVDYLVGQAPFFSMMLQVNESVLVPRPSTETLVEHVIQHARRTPGFAHPTILDIGTGSGAIAIAIARTLRQAQVIATDISTKALDVAKANADEQGVSDRIEFVQGCLFEPVTGKRFDYIVSNPPYVSDAEYEVLDANVRDYEPASALRGGPEGLDVVAPLVDQSINFLSDPGHLAIEIASTHAGKVREMAEKRAGLTHLRILTDHEQLPRVFVADFDG